MEEQENTSGFLFYTNGHWSMDDKTHSFKAALEQLLERFLWKNGYVKVTIEFYPLGEER